jgi:hypothetical protein
LFERRRLMTLVSICAWCGKTIGTGGTNGESESTLITHGICRSCKERVLGNAEKEEPEA